MIEQETLFDLTPEEKHGEIEEIDIEYVQVAMEKKDKKGFYIMCEEIIKKGQTGADNYSDLIYNLIKGKHDDIKSKL